MSFNRKTDQTVTKLIAMTDDIDGDEVLYIKTTTQGTKCEMVNCKSNSDGNVCKKSYFRFPKHDYRCSQWVFACGRPDLVKLYLKRGAMFMYKTRKVCEEHFVRADFRNPDLLSQGLFNDVVPTRNLPKLTTTIHITRKHQPEEDATTSAVADDAPLKRNLRERKSNRCCCDALETAKRTVRIKRCSKKKILVIVKTKQSRKRGRPKKN
ncbi:uncharacterized protein LOC126843978 [Adelges cooleyi]|uniref:uncharacterized protein LOC126843978 n=1 Tax=Adelges cooleyi TaxID=133065 RepID=UPI00217F4899|nr:uncharacterized protein LOC126843978 [Adelges cooleyi]